MPPIRTRRNRHNRLLVGVASAALSALGSCGTANKFELTLRDRELRGPAADFHERTWTAQDGRIAVSLVHPNFFIDVIDGIDWNMRWNVGITQFGSVVCDGQQRVGHLFYEFDRELAPGEGSFELEIDDGNRLTLDPQTGVRVFDLYDYENLCFEETGTWRGTAGELVDRTGTYSLRDDSIQIVLRLVED